MATTAIMSYNFFLEIDGEYIEDLGNITQCQWCGCGVTRDFFEGLVDDVADTHVTVAAERLALHQEYICAQSMVPSAPITVKALRLLKMQLESLVANCSDFSLGVVRLSSW